MTVNGSLAGKIHSCWVPKRTRYLVKIEQTGYETSTMELRIPQKKYGRPIQTCENDKMIFCDSSLN